MKLHGKVARTVAIILLTCGLWTCAEEPPSKISADLILRNGAIYTLDASRRWAQAAAIADGRILYVGTDAEAQAFAGAGTRVLDLQGRMVLPGFHDSHVHPVYGGIELGQCNLHGLESQEQIFEAIQRCVEARPQAAWIVGGGWDLPAFPNANPTREQLDRLVADRPAYLSAMDGHSAWVNSRALEIAGITRETPDPEDGRIERDPATGEPSGTLRENAMELVAKHLLELTDADYVEGLRRGLEMANRFGITSIQEASADDKVLAAYAELERRGELTLRVTAAIYVDPKKGEAQVTDLVQQRAKYRGTKLRAIAAKIYADGVIESRTAALLEPYLDRPEYRGIPNLQPELFHRLATALDREGFQIHIHAIGDRGIRMALDALEVAQRANGGRDARHHVAHLQLIDPDDIPRFRRLGVVANFQPLWAYADRYISELTEPALGPERSRWLYPIGSVAKSGAVIAAGSDWSVSSMNPLDAIQVAVTRRGLDDGEGQPWIPQELVDLPAILAAYTINGAYLNHQEHLTGSIEAGKFADLIVLDRNLFEIPPEEIHRARVVLTLLEGREVYRHESFDQGE